MASYEFSEDGSTAIVALGRRLGQGVFTTQTRHLCRTLPSCFCCGLGLHLLENMPIDAKWKHFASNVKRNALFS